jgi:hypothetical protein
MNIPAKHNVVPVKNTYHVWSRGSGYTEENPWVRNFHPNIWLVANVAEDFAKMMNEKPNHKLSKHSVVLVRDWHGDLYAYTVKVIPKVIYSATRI